MEKLSEQLGGLADEFAKMAAETDIDDSDIYACPLCRDCGWIIEGTSARPCVCQKRRKAVSAVCLYPICGQCSLVILI